MSQWLTFFRACPTSWRLNSWHRYGMKKLHHGHPMRKTSWMHQFAKLSNSKPHKKQNRKWLG